MALAQLAGADPTNLFTQVKYGITTYESAINTIINNLSAYGITPGYGETNLDALFDGSSASNAVLTQLGIPTSSYDPTNAYIKQECQSYLSWCSSYGIDPSDTNIASMFDAKHLVDACSQLQDAGKDPTSLSVQAAAGIPTQESSKIQTIMQTCTNKGWTTVDQMEADISSGDWGLLQQMGLTNQTSWQGAPGGRRTAISSISLYSVKGRGQFQHHPQPFPQRL